MSYALDANILLYATNAASSFHPSARALVERAAAGPELVYLPWPVVMDYLRISTHPAIFERPLAPSEAEASSAETFGSSADSSGTFGWYSASRGTMER